MAATVTLRVLDNDASASSLVRVDTVTKKNVFVTVITVGAIALATNVLADSQVYSSGRAMSQLASSVSVDARAAQHVADLAVVDANVVNDAQVAGLATAGDAESADLSAEGASTIAADMIAAKRATAAAAREMDRRVARNESQPLISGDEPMNVGNAAQVEAPSPAPQAQDRTAVMLQREAGLINGQTNPVDQGDAAQIKAPAVDATAQAATAKALSRADNEAGAITGKYD